MGGTHQSIPPCIVLPSSSRALGRSLPRSCLILAGSRMYLAWLLKQGMLQVSGLMAAVTGLWQLPPREVLLQAHQLLSQIGMWLCLRCPKTLKLRSALGPGVLRDIPPGLIPGQPEPGSARPVTAFPSLPSGQWAHDAVEGQQ